MRKIRHWFMFFIFVIFTTLPCYGETALIYCHEGFGKPQPYFMRDAKSYEKAGFAVFVAVFSDENGGPPIASEDIQIIKEIAENLVYKGYTVNMVGVSLGGYRALEAFLRYPELFDRVVIYMAPINITDDYDWISWASRHTEEDLQMATNYFSEIESPIELASQGFGQELGDRILLIYGGRDKICPKEDCLLFEELTGAECIIYGRNGHDVSLNKKAIRQAVEFLK